MIHKFLHFSDSHQSTTAETTAMNIINSAPKNYIPCYSGDYAFQKISDGYNVSIVNGCYGVIGNHDRMENGDSNNIVPVSNSLCYNTFFTKGYTHDHAKFNTNVSNPTYWSSVLDNNTIRLIGLDSTISNSSDLEEMCKWLSNELNLSRKNNQKCIIMQHIISRGKYIMKSTFTNSDFWFNQKWYKIGNDQSSNYWVNTIERLDTILSRNADVIAFCMYGHEHADGICWEHNYPEIIIGDSYLGDIGVFNNVVRSTVLNQKDTLVMNMYVYDDKKETLEIYRLGASDCTDGTKRYMCVLDLSEKDVISDFSNTYLTR